MSCSVMSEAEWVQGQVVQHDGLSGFQLLVQGMEAYARRMLLAERATRSLDIQTYIFEDGHSTRRILRQLIASAERGVKVRLLIDDLSVGHQQGRLARLDSHPNIEVRVFNPIPWGRRLTLTRMLSLVVNVRRLQRRMHNKLWIADDTLAIWGGRNLSDVYFSSDSRHSFFDMDALCAGGDTAAQLSKSFSRYWHHALAVPLSTFICQSAGSWRELDEELTLRCAEQSRVGSEYNEAVDELRGDSREEFLQRLHWAGAEVHYDDPQVAAYPGRPPADMRMSSAVKQHMDRVNDSLHIVAGYFIPHDLDGIDLFKLLERNIKVTVVTNALEATDVPLVHGCYARWRTPLLKAGVRLYEIRFHPRSRPRLHARLRARTRLKLSRPRTGSLHAKTYAFDHDRIMVASFNFDPRSVWWNCELGVVIQSDTLNHELRMVNAISMLPEYSYRLRIVKGALRWFSISGTGRLRQYCSERGNLWRRIQGWLARVLRLDSLL